MHNNTFTWTVIGAGPAGIIAVGKLLDIGIDAKKIAWIDPEFRVGDFGTIWRNVSSNTNVGGFIRVFKACRSFKYVSAPDFAIKKRDPYSTCRLALAADPLQWISDHLKNTVCSIQGKVTQLNLHDKYWHLNIDNTQLCSKNVILAFGADQKSLSYSDVEEISLKVALDPYKLPMVCNQEDTIGVFGSSHSAILTLKTLLEKCNVKKIINFYLSPLRYQVVFGDWILFGDTGLKARAATWAKKNIEGKLPDKLERIISNEANIQHLLPSCTKVIYAIGFQKRHITCNDMQTLDYHHRIGIIASGLFGVGIAFPQAQFDGHGTVEFRVGLEKFSSYLDNVLPIWVNYGI